MSDIEFDFSQFEAFANNFSANVREDFLNDGMDDLGNALLSSVKQKTPADTGHLRRQWSFDGVEHGGNSFVATVYNNTEYAIYVDKGHRTRGGSGWVEGVFMCDKALQEVSGQMDSVVGHTYQRYLRGLGFD